MNNNFYNNSRRVPQMSLDSKLNQILPLLASIGIPFGPSLQPIPAMATHSPMDFNIGFAHPMMTGYALTNPNPPPQNCYKRFKPSIDFCYDFDDNRRNRYRHWVNDSNDYHNYDSNRFNGQRNDKPKNFFGYRGNEPLVVTPEDEATVEKLKLDGAVPHTENGQHGFKCQFCDKFINSLTAAVKHFESPKHIRARNLENLMGNDGKFVLKSDKIIDPSCALARNKEFNRLTKTQREAYCDQGIRLKDGFGSEAYFCAVCTIAISSIKVVEQHIKDKKHLTNMAANKLGVPATECPVIDVEIDEEPLQSLEERLENFKEPVIGLEYVIEYIDPDVNMQRIYKCKLCETWNPVATVLAHLTGYPHRTNYIKIVNPNDSYKFCKRNKDSMSLCEELATQLEKEMGRQKWMVCNEKPDLPKDGVLANKFADSFQIGLNNKRRKTLEENGIDHLRQFIGTFYDLRLQENCRVGDDNDLQNCVIIINTLTEVLLKHKLRQFPDKIRGLVAHKLMYKGIIDSFTNDYNNTFNDNHCNLNNGKQIDQFSEQVNERNPESDKFNSEQIIEEVAEEIDEKVKNDAIVVENKTKEGGNDLLLASNDTEEPNQSFDNSTTNQTNSSDDETRV